MNKDTEIKRKSSISHQQIEAHLAKFLGENAAKKTTPIRPQLIPFYGDWETAAFVTQLLYWQDKAEKTGGWVYKTYAEWGEELAINPQLIQRRIEKLCKLYIEKGRPKLFNGKKRTRLKVNKEKHLKLMEEHFTTNCVKYQNDI